MGIAGSKDDRGVRVLQALPPGFLDERGKELRNELDLCLEQNGWYFTIGAYEHTRAAHLVNCLHWCAVQAAAPTMHLPGSSSSCLLQGR